METAESIITDGLRAAIGREAPPRRVEVERTAIRRYADAIQDPNPIYVDEAFARRTPFGSIIAPPTFLCTFEHDRVPLALPTPPAYTEVLNGGSGFHYQRPLRLHDVLEGTCRLVEAYERDGTLGRMLFLVQEEVFRDRQGTPVAREVQTRILYRQPDASARRSPEAAPKAAPASDEPDVPPDAGTARPAQRCFEDVTVGEALPRLAKRPTLRHLVMYAGASGNFAEYHYDPEDARRLGMPGIILHGNLKVAYLGQIVTDWIGTGGFVTELTARIRGMDLLGETCLIQGRVTGRRETAEGGHVEIEVWAEAPGGRRTTLGQAVAFLPRRGHA